MEKIVTVLEIKMTLLLIFFADIFQTKIDFFFLVFHQGKGKSLLEKMLYCGFIFMNINTKYYQIREI